MNKNDIIKLLKENPVFYLGTIEDNFPRVREMLLYKIDETGIYFHTARTKNLYSQVLKNSNAELCFNCKEGIQIRLSGNLAEIKSEDLKDEIMNDPGREFLRKWKDEGYVTDIYKDLIVFKLIYDVATLWTMDSNFEAKKTIDMTK